MCARAAVHGGWTDRGRGTDRQSYSGGNLRCADLRPVQSRDESACQHQAARVFAAAAIHDTDGHNPHAHILLTVRPLNEQGKWQYKTEKEYLCMKNGKERGFTAAEFRTAQKRGLGETVSLQGRQKEGVYDAIRRRCAGACPG